MARHAQCHCFSLTSNHGTFPCGLAFQVFEFSNMMNFQIHIFCTAPFTFSGFQSRDKAVSTCTEILVWHGIKVTSCGRLHMAEPLVVEQQCCPSLFCLVFDAKILTNAVLISDFPNMRLVFCAKAIQSTYHDFYALGNGSNWGVYI